MKDQNLTSFKNHFIFPIKLKRLQKLLKILTQNNFISINLIIYNQLVSAKVKFHFSSIHKR